MMTASRDPVVLLQFPPVLPILWSKEQRAKTLGQAQAHGKATGGVLPTWDAALGTMKVAVAPQRQAP